MSKSRGLFRWPGGKSHVVDRIAPMIQAHLAVTGGRLISLFHGGGAVERALGGAHIAADKSPELLQLFADLQTFSPAEMHAALIKFDDTGQRTAEHYKQIGLDGPAGWGPMEGTARFLWLSAMSFNGVWRVNGDGQMNMGVDRVRLAKPPAEVLPPLEAFEFFAEQIARTKFVEGWQNARALALPGDVLFVDPPYGAFDGYTAAGFEWEDHGELAGSLRAAADRGMGVIAFNEATSAPIRVLRAIEKEEREHAERMARPGLFDKPAPLRPKVTNMTGFYSDWAQVETLLRKGNVSCDAEGRQPREELLITAALRGQ